MFIRNKFYNNIKKFIKGIINYSYWNIATSNKIYHKIKRIHDSLMDVQSKKLFLARFNVTLSNNHKYLFDELIKIKRKIKKDDLISLINKNTPGQTDTFVLYGSGSAARQVYQLFLSYGINFSCLVKEEDKLNERDILIKLPNISINKLKSEFPHAYIIVSEKMNSVRRRLINKGFSSKKIIGKKTTWDVQYFDKNIFVPDDNEIFVDGGCFDLKNSIDFINWCDGRYEKIYAFELDVNNYKNCLSILENSEELNKDKISIMNFGLWKTKKKLKYEGVLSSAMISDSGSTEVMVVRLDSIIKSRVTLIKLDIEGAEIAALKGAKNIIKKYKPKMAICIYHKPENIIDIPLYILKLCPEYKFYIRHHSTWRTETVLYCVIT